MSLLFLLGENIMLSILQELKIKFSIPLEALKGNRAPKTEDANASVMNFTKGNKTKTAHPLNSDALSASTIC